MGPGKNVVSLGPVSSAPWLRLMRALRSGRSLCVSPWQGVGALSTSHAAVALPRSRWIM